MTNVAKPTRCVNRIGEDDVAFPVTGHDRDPFLDAGRYTFDPDGCFGLVRQLLYYSSGVGMQSSLSVDSGFSGLAGKGK